jgi:hypothetical protein
VLPKAVGFLLTAVPSQVEHDTADRLLAACGPLVDRELHPSDEHDSVDAVHYRSDYTFQQFES